MNNVLANIIALISRERLPFKWRLILYSLCTPKIFFRTPSFDKEEDPSTSIMKMMKQMYDDGDDEMKRTISKAWTESREKQAAGNLGL